MTVMRWLTVCSVAMTFFALNCSADVSDETSTNRAGTIHLAQIPNAGSLAAGGQQALGVPWDVHPTIDRKRAASARRPHERSH